MKRPTKTARTLRKNSTDVESILWQELRSRRFAHVKFRRQHPIKPYVADFACPEHHMVIELDGGQHAENEADAKRTVYLNEKGWRVMRFWNNEIIENLDGILIQIQEALALES